MLRDKTDIMLKNKALFRVRLPKPKTFAKIEGYLVFQQRRKNMHKPNRFPEVMISAYARQQISLSREWPNIRQLISNHVNAECSFGSSSAEVVDFDYQDAEGVSYKVVLDRALSVATIRLKVEDQFTAS